MEEENTTLVNDNHNKKTIRQSNFELLRIFAIILIIMDHSQHGILSYSNFATYNYYIYICITKFGQLGVILFFLISGYFLCTKELKIQSIIRIYLEVVFYNFLFWIVALIYEYINCDPTFNDLLSINIILRNFILLKENYWFIFSYLILFLLSPFLNKISQQISQKSFRILIIVLFFYSEIYSRLIADSAYYSFNNILKVVLIYLFGSYIRFYHSEKDVKNNIIYILLFLISISICVLDASLGSPLVFQEATFPLMIAGVSLFLIVKNMKDRHSKVVNLLGGCTLGVYLIHESPYIRDILWQKVLPFSNYANSEFFVLIFLGFCFLVFMVSTIIEIFRQKCLEKPIMTFINKKLSKFIDRINNLFPKTQVVETEKEHSSDKLFVTFILVISLVTYISLYFKNDTINAVSLFLIISFILIVLLGIFYLLFKTIKKYKNKSQKDL